MPVSLEIGCFVFGAILLLIALLGGNFKLFGAEIASGASNTYIRILSFFLGALFIGLVLLPKNKEGLKLSEQSETRSTSDTDPGPQTSSNLETSESKSTTSGCTITTKFRADLLVEPDAFPGQSIKQIPRGEKLNVIEKKRADMGYYYKVQYEDTEGWLYGQLVVADNCF